MNQETNVYSYIRTEETAFKTTQITLQDGYQWNMSEHIRMSTLFRDSKFTKGNNDFSRPFRNIIRRIRNLALVAMDFDVKDIVPFVNDSAKYYMSFLVKKYHPQWARKHNLDTYIDELIESYEDYGLALSKHVNKIAPEIVPLQSIAFCDQTDILSGPICIKHQYSPSQLKEFEGKWKNIDEVITLARNEKTTESGNQTINTPGKFIPVYEFDGMCPVSWLKEEDAVYDKDAKYSHQMWVITFYKDENDNKHGITLFKGKGDPKKYKALVRDKIFGRACGMGGIEELFQSQIWANYDEIRIQEMLDAASKIIHITTDSGLAQRNKIGDMEQNEFITAKENTETHQLNTQPVNLIAFQNASTRWEEHAKGIGSAYDAQLGESPTSGTPFALQNAIIAQGEGLHAKRKGKIATHLGEVYRDWILEDLAQEMSNEKEFSEELSLDEMQYVAESIVTNETNTRIKEMVLSGETPTPEIVDTFKQVVREGFMKGGNKKFFKILKGELKGLPLDVEVNIAGKQANLAQVADKMSNLFRQIFANPQGFVATMQIPGASSSFNELLESSGMSPWKFNELTQAKAQQMMQQPGAVPSPMQQPLSTGQPLTATPAPTA